MVDAEKKSSLRKMLSDAVPLLCRSSLGIYNSKLSVEAIICITVNNTDLVHISFNEILTAGGSTVSHVWRKCESNNIDEHSGEQQPERSKESSDASSSSDLGRLNNQPATDDVDALPTFDDQNLGYEAVDASGVDLDQWNEIKPNDSWGDSTARKRRNRQSSVDKLPRLDRQSNCPDRRVLDESSHSKHDEVEAALPASQTSTPGLAAPDIKVEQLESEDCLFVKMETDINDDSYGFSTMADITAFDASFSVRKRVRTQASSFDNHDAVARHSFARSTASKTYSHVAQRQSHVRPRSGNAAQDERNRSQGNHSLALPDFQSTSTALSSSGALLPFSLENHHPEPIPPTASQFAPKKRCRVCYAKKVRKEVRFCCSACPDRPGLCLDPCFYEYHELFVIPKFFPQGAISEHGRGSVQERNSPVEHGRADLLRLPDVSGEARQPPDA